MKLFLLIHKITKFILERTQSLCKHKDKLFPKISYYSYDCQVKLKGSSWVLSPQEAITDHCKTPLRPPQIDPPYSL